MPSGSNQPMSPVARFGLAVPAARCFTTPSIVTTDSARSPSSTGSAAESASATICVSP